MSKNKKSSKVKMTLKILFGSVYLLIVVLYAVFLFANLQSNIYGENARILGKYFYTVADAKHSAVIANPQTTVGSGDVIVYQKNDLYYTGRVIMVNSDNTVRALTSGADNEEIIQAVDIYGVAIRKIPYLGMIFSFLLSYWGIIVLIVIPCFAFLVIQVIQLIRYSRHMHREQEEEEDGYNLGSLENSGSVSAEPGMRSRSQEAITYSPSKTSTMRSNFENDYERVRQKLEREKALSEWRQKSSGVTAPLKNTSLEEFLKQTDSDLDETLGELRYKMKFQDTKEISQYHETIIEENREIPNLNKYGLQTSLIEDGVEIKMDPKFSDSCVLRLKNDGSLQIVTEAYIANIDAIV